MAPVRLRLRVNLGVSLHLGGGAEQDLGPGSFGQAQHVDGAHGVGLDRLDRVVHIVRRGGWGGQVIDLVHLDEERVDDVVVEELKVLVANPVLDVPFLAGEEIVSDQYLMARQHQLVNQM